MNALLHNDMSADAFLTMHRRVAEVAPTAQAHMDEYCLVCYTEVENSPVIPGAGAGSRRAIGT
jgi:hypothetical protein